MLLLNGSDFVAPVSVNYGIIVFMKSEKVMKKVIEEIIEQQNALDALKEANKEAIHGAIFRYIKAKYIGRDPWSFPYRGPNSFDIEEWNIDPILQTIDVYVLNEYEHAIPLKYLYDSDLLDAFVKEKEDEHAERQRKIKEQVEQSEMVTLKTLQKKFDIHK